MLPWMLIAVSFMLIFEARIWHDYVVWAGLPYALNDVLVRAYDWNSAGLRLGLMFSFALCSLAAREWRALADSGWTYVIILGPVALYAWLTLRAYRRSINAYCLRIEASQHRK